MANEGSTKPTELELCKQSNWANRRRADSAESELARVRGLLQRIKNMQASSKPDQLLMKEVWEIVEAELAMTGGQETVAGEEVIAAGVRMSNLIYNVLQTDCLTAERKRMYGEVLDAWDTKLISYREICWKRTLRNLWRH